MGLRIHIPTPILSRLWLATFKPYPCAAEQHRISPLKIFARQLLNDDARPENTNQGLRP